MAQGARTDQSANRLAAPMWLWQNFQRAALNLPTDE
jgi:hypothetical protein